MSKPPQKRSKPSIARRAAAPEAAEFDVVLELIDAARTRAVAAVNTTIIELYSNIGQYVSRKIVEDGWGKGTVRVLSQAIQRRFPGVTGYSSQNLWRMRQFFETYHGKPKLSPLVRELSWTHNLLIMSRCKRDDEREFYHHVGSQHPLQVGGRDFALDLLFFNRALNCLVAIEIKIGEFQPEHLGKLEFYLEALDRDVKKPHERPSIGVLLCATKDHEVVEYALSRSMSPALVAEYQTRLPDKGLLQAKLHEFYEIAREKATPPTTQNRKQPSRGLSKARRGTAR
jgi:predicted nuclease of restriction endonuclease-like (RecB) superfamily